MSFSFLLMILSLIVIVPVVFVVRKNTATQRLTSNQQHQHYLTNHAKEALHESHPDLKIADTINYYRNHTKLPISFRQILSKIKEEYLVLSSASLAPDQRFTVDKLVGTRLPEIMEDYLALDSDYATTTIIDSSKELTSQDVTYGQLVSMMAFMQRLSDSGQAQVATNILANRSYLKSVYGEFYEDDSSVETIKAPTPDDLADISLLSDKTLLELGETYLKDCDHLSSNDLSLTSFKEVLGESIIIQLGELIYLAEKVLIYTDALLTEQISLKVFDTIIGQSIPNLLRQVLSDQSSKTNETIGLTSDEHSLVEQKIDRITQLIEDCFNKLEKVADAQYDDDSIPTNHNSEDRLQDLQNTINSRQSQAKYLLESGFFNL